MITNVSLTTKERYLLEDQKTHEQICIQKYNNYANLACDAELKSIFKTNATQEEQHLNSINQILNGQVPSMGNQQSQGGSSGQSGMSGQQSQTSSNSMQQNSSFNNSQTTDKDLCTDILMTEKYVSSAYNQAIFEFRDPAIRDVLNHIQKEEQQHGESVFKYMESKGLYTPK